MKETRRLKITTTVRRIVRYQAPAVRGYCPICAREVETLNPTQAAEVLEVAAPQLNQFITAGRVHTLETVSGSLRICQDSLF